MFANASHTAPADRAADHKPVRDGGPTISAVVCTYNRSHLLRDTLESLVDQTLPRDDYEIVIVDNNSTDATESVVQSFIAAHPEHQVRLIFEAKQGLSHARNTGYRRARGRFVAYLDDDALAAREWLAAAMEAFEHVTPTPLVVVGPVFPRYPEGKPDWFNDRIETYDLGPQPLFLPSSRSFMGGNMMFAKNILEEFEGFDSRFGVQGAKLWLAEELELLLRMRRRFGADCPIYYDPQVSILHAVPRAKLRPGYVLSRSRLNGKCRYLIRGENSAGIAGREACVAIARIGWLAAKAILNSWRYSSPRSWLSERVGPLAVQSGYLEAALRSALRLR